jgi:DegV family protein with EDD domain
MNSICFLTDSSVQFPQPSFPGRNLIQIVPLNIQINGRNYDQLEEAKAGVLPTTASDEMSPKLAPPSIEKFQEIFYELTKKYNEVTCIFLSSELNGCYSHAIKAAQSIRGGSIQIIDSQTTSIGLGILVQTAAEAASRGLPFSEIDRLVRNLIPRIYAVFCIPALSYLYYNGFVDYAQATISEMLGLLTVFSLEEGKLSPIEKMRNHRHILDFFLEFMDEFDGLQHISLIQSAPPNSQDAHLIREHAQQNFPRSPFTAHTINFPLSVLFGPRSLGLFVIEGENIKNH